MEVASVSDFRNNLRGYLDDVEIKGEHIVVMRGGKAVAEVIPFKRDVMTEKRIPKRIKLKTSATEALLQERAQHGK